ncbi:MAG TPA: hypothetical protein VJ304_15555 [Flavobacterium sp.]|nr:uncharacterized protein [Chryseobacterium sp.]HJY14210.1 hypothetical protein [Flavobacterium sp.]
MEKSTPDYRRIYSDIIKKKFPQLIEEYSPLLDKKNLSVLDVLEINRKLFGIPRLETARFDQRHRSYSKSDIFEILDYQTKYKLNNSQLAVHFKLSRNTVAKWKKLFMV